jgi:O-antigen ligase
MEIVAIVAGIAGIVWAAVLFRRGGLVAGGLAVLLAGACFSVPFFKLELGPIPLTADRVLLVALVAQYISWRRWECAGTKAVGKPEILLCLFLAVLAVSTFTHDWQGQGLKYAYQPVSWLIISYLMPAAVYWIVRQAKISEGEVLVVFGAFALFGIYLAVTSLAEYFDATWAVFPTYIVTSAKEETAEFVGRGRGPLLNPIGNGVLLAICLGSALMWWPRLRRVGQLTLLAVSLLLLAATYCSLTRSVWIGGILTLVLAVGLALPWSWRGPLLIGGLLVGVVIGATQWDNILAFKRDKNLSAAETADSASLRPILATIAWHMFLERPLFGCGYAQYEVESRNYTSDRTSDLPLERGRGFIQHNVALSLLTETGIVGLSLFAAMLFFWTRDAWQLWRDVTLPLWARQAGLLFLIAIVAYLTNGMFHDVSVISMMNMTLFFLAGLVAGLRPLLPCNRIVQDEEVRGVTTMLPHAR